MIKDIKEGSKDKKISGHHEEMHAVFKKILELLGMKNIVNVFFF